MLLEDCPLSGEQSRQAGRWPTNTRGQIPRLPRVCYFQRALTLSPESLKLPTTVMECSSKFEDNRQTWRLRSKGVLAPHKKHVPGPTRWAWGAAHTPVKQNCGANRTSSWRKLRGLNWEHGSPADN